MAEALPPREKLAALLDLAQRFNSERNLDNLLDLITEEAARLLGAERASLFLLEEGGAVLSSRVALGSNETIRVQSTQGIAGEVASSGRTIRVDDAYRDPRFYAGIDSQSGFRTYNLLAVPLRALDGEVLGVFEILNKRAGPFDDEDTALTEALAGTAALAVKNALLIAELEKHRATLESENRNLMRELGGRIPGKTLIGSSAPLTALRDMILRVADTDVTVLVTGESGTGKDLVARSIHFASGRARGPFVALNCAALPETLVETELFGVEKGVATGVERRAGKFEQAEGGTLFLDEIGDLSPTAQAKILRALQERVVERVGGRQTRNIDVRVVAATNKDLETEIRKGGFREDLYYRLNVLRLRTPSLREIRSDIPLLARHFLTVASQELRVMEKQLSPEAAEILQRFDWPGNARQLENEMRRAAVLSRGNGIEVSDLSDEVRRGSAPAPLETGHAGEEDFDGNLTAEVEALERKRIREALARNQYNQLRTAKALGLSRQGLINKLKRYGIAVAPDRA